MYFGLIGILLMAMLEGERSVKDLAHASSLCGACAEACPVRIDIPCMLIELRRDVNEGRIVLWAERVAFKLLVWILTRPRFYRFAVRAARMVQRPFARGGTIARLP